MKTIKIILLSMLLALLTSSCCKDDIQGECEINNTFQLHFYSLNGVKPIELCIIDKDTTKYLVNYQERIVVDVDVDYIKIFTLYNNTDTLGEFTLRPNPCANLNYVY